MTTCKGILLVIRPVNVIISFLSVLLAVMICNPRTPMMIMLLAGATAAFVTAGANAINDFYDIEIDHINRPNRPLPMGLLSQSAARTICFVFFTTAIGLGLSLNCVAAVIVICSCILLYYYSARLKRTVLWGNLTVSLITGLAFVFGGVAAGSIRQAMYPAAFAFLSNGAREIIKDIEDIPGDRSLQIRTLPLVHGVRTAQVVTTAVLVALLAVTIVAYVSGFYGWWYFTAVMTVVNPFIIYVLITLWRRHDAKGLRRMSTLLKVAMLTGLLAIYLGRFK
jgi:geranylgeranylglycerol-phosphate geranylgeranyltransferase